MKPNITKCKPFPLIIGTKTEMCVLLKDYDELNKKCKRLEKLLENAIHLSQHAYKVNTGVIFLMIENLPFVPSNQNQEEARKIVKELE